MNLTLFLSRVQQAVAMSGLVGRLFNTGLRLGSLGAKLVLTLYMGRYLGLSEMGVYGLVAAYVAIAIPLLGLRIDYSVSREIVDISPLQLVCRMRDQASFYLLNYIVFAIMMLAAPALGLRELDARIAGFALTLSILESLATMTAGNLVSLRRPILSNLLFFIRAAAWVVPVIGLGLLWPEWRNANVVFLFWIAGVTSSLLITLWVWRQLPWRAVWSIPIDWGWIRRQIGLCLFIWLGAVGAAASGNIDRFVVDHFLGREFVGIASFYGSFVLAITSLLYSGIFAFGFPQLVALHRDGNPAAFWLETRRMGLQAIVAVTVMVVLFGVLVPWLGARLGRAEFAEHAPTLWLVLLGTWIKSVTDVFYYVMYARLQDRPIWIGNILLLLVALLANALLVPWLGFAGIGYGAIIAALFICLWRIWFVLRPGVADSRISQGRI